MELLLAVMVENELSQDETRARLKELALQTKADSKSPNRLRDYTPTSADRRRRIERFFNEKIKYLSLDHNLLDAALAEVISYLHKYRNKAQHQGKIRKATLYPAVRVLFEIATDLFATMPISTFAASSSDDYQWLKMQYGIQPTDLIEVDARRKVSEQLIKEIIPDTHALGESLALHISSRADELLEALDFIAENMQSAEDRATALKAIQYWQEFPDRPFIENDDRFRQYSPQHDLKLFERISQQVENLTNIPNRIEVFRVFSEIEWILEPVENQVYEVSAQVERHIQLEIDLRLGK